MKLTLNEHDDAMLDLSKTLFWKGYSIWKKRKALISDFWKHSPNEWNTQGGKVPKLTNPFCSNPFQYFPLHADLSKKRQTLCYCSKFKDVRVHPDRDVRDFLIPPVFPVINVRAVDFSTREDLVREDCDAEAIAV